MMERVTAAPCVSVVFVRVFFLHKPLPPSRQGYDRKGAQLAAMFVFVCLSHMHTHTHKHTHAHMHTPSTRTHARTHNTHTHTHTGGHDVVCRSTLTLVYKYAVVLVVHHPCLGERQVARACHLFIHSSLYLFIYLFIYLSIYFMHHS